MGKYFSVPADRGLNIELRKEKRRTYALFDSYFILVQPPKYC